MPGCAELQAGVAGFQPIQQQMQGLLMVCRCHDKIHFAIGIGSMKHLEAPVPADLLDGSAIFGL
jgi:hypothetical protein